MKIAQCIGLFVLLLRAKCQQYNCSLYYNKNGRTFSTVTVLDRCPSSGQCEHSNHSYDLAESKHFVEEETNKVGMRFSWKPKHINATAPFCGFKITTQERLSSFHDSTYFCPNITEYPEQSEVSFECKKMALPRELYAVTISPLPEDNYDLFLNFTAKIPACSSNTSIRAASECIGTHARISITRNISCENSTFEVGYAIPRKKATATVRVCSRPMPETVLCNGVNGLLFEDLPLVHKINITLPKNVSTEHFYYVQVFSYNSVSQIEGTRYIINVTNIFQACVEPPRVSSEFQNFPEQYIAIIAVLVLCCIIFGIIAYKTRCSSSAITSLVKPTFENEPVVPESQTLYIVYVCDHKMHQDVVLKFAAYLKYDLGFQILLECYETTEIFQDPSAWMENSFFCANKVLFVWSPMAAKRWNESDEQKTLADMFTPVLRKADLDMRNSDNYKKYYFINFNYCNSDIVPAKFKTRRCNFFNLLDDFGDFLFKLLGLESSRCIQFCFDESYCELTDSQYGQPLSDAIEEMKHYVQIHTNWFEESQTISSCENPAPSCNEPSENVIINLTNEIKIIPPVPISQKNFTAYDNPVLDTNVSFVEFSPQHQSAKLSRTNFPSSSTRCEPLKLCSRVLVEHSLPEEISEESNNLLSTLDTKQLSNNFSENGSLLQNHCLKKQSKSSQLKPNTISLAPIDLHSDPMTSLNAINKQAQISHL